MGEKDLVERRMVERRKEPAIQLAKIEERTLNIWKTVEKIERQLEIQNGNQRDTNDRSIRNTTKIKLMTGVGSAIAIIIVGVLITMLT